jgi:hypothetical protein
MAGRELVRFGNGPPDEEDSSVRILLPSHSDSLKIFDATLDISAKRYSVELPRDAVNATGDLKRASLALLAIQNCCYILSMKYSKHPADVDGKHYLSTTVVVMVSDDRRTCLQDRKTSAFIHHF